MSRRSIQGLALPLQVSNIGIDGVAVPDAMSIKQGALKLSSNNATAPSSSILALPSGVLVVNPSDETSVPAATSAVGLGIGFSMDGPGDNECDFINYCNKPTGTHSGFTFWQSRTGSNAIPIMYLSDVTYGGLVVPSYAGAITVQATDDSANCSIGGVANQMVFTAAPEPAGHATAFAWACSNAGGASSYPMTLNTAVLTLGANVGFIVPGSGANTIQITGASLPQVAGGKGVGMVYVGPSGFLSVSTT